MPLPDGLPAELKERAGAFVSLKKNGQLRGCIGTFAPTQPTIGDEIIYNAINAGTEDPRFRPVKPSELREIDISVDILSAPEQVSNMAELDAQKYGVIVRHGGAQVCYYLRWMALTVLLSRWLSPGRKPVFRLKKKLNYIVFR